MPHTFKLGRKPRSFRPMLHWSALRYHPAPAPPIPASHNWLAGMPSDFGVMANDQLGCCVCASVYHALQVWSYNANPPENTQPAAAIVALYEQDCGYDPSDPNSDQGCNEQDVLLSWYRRGVPLAGGAVDKLLIPPVEIDVRNLGDVREAIYQCGGIVIGFQVPAFLMAGTPPAVWDVEPASDNSIIGGHAVAVAGYDAGMFNLISWGQAFEMTTAFWHEFVDEAYALCSPDWVEKTGSTPLGLTAAQLEALARSV